MANSSLVPNAVKQDDFNEKANKVLNPDDLLIPMIQVSNILSETPFSNFYKVNSKSEEVKNNAKQNESKFEKMGPTKKYLKNNQIKEDEESTQICTQKICDPISNEEIKEKKKSPSFNIDQKKIEESKKNSESSNPQENIKNQTPQKVQKIIKINSINQLKNEQLFSLLTKGIVCEKINSPQKSKEPPIMLNDSIPFNFETLNSNLQFINQYREMIKAENDGIDLDDGVTIKTHAKGEFTQECGEDEQTYKVNARGIEENQQYSDYI